MPNASQPKKSMINSPQVAAIVGVVCGVVGVGVAFVLSSFPIAVMGGVGAVIGVILGIVGVVVTKPGMLNSIAMAGTALLVGGGGGAGMWFLTHPGVWVDNPSADTLTIFVDGEKIGTVKPNANAKFNIAKGERKLGYATGKAKKPEETVKADVEMGGNHLYNPGKTGCYWLQVDVYGSANAGTKKQGPLEIKEFYTFDSVDNWFKDNPEVVSVDKKSSGTTKTAVRYANMCMEFKKCSLAVRDKLAKCTIKAFDKESEEAMQACGDEAAAKCDPKVGDGGGKKGKPAKGDKDDKKKYCLLYTSPSPRD